MTSWRSLHRRLVARRHTALLVAIVVAFGVRPVVGDAGLGPVAFSLGMLAVLLAALYAVELDEVIGDHERVLARRRRRRLIAWTLALLAILERLVMVLTPNPGLAQVGLLSWFAFFAFVTWIELRTVLEQREVSGETISMAISVYLLMGITWGLLYFVLFQTQQDAFSFVRFSAAESAPSHDFKVALPIFMYFSLTTLSTVGFGDITPVTLAARYAAVAESITGQFYLAILVARLVSLQISGGRPGGSR